MAFGSPRSGSPLTNQSTNSGTGYSVAGSISVSPGDLIVVNYGLRTNTSVTVSDNLGNTYTALDSSGNNNAISYAFFTRVTSSGTLSSVTTSHASTNVDSAFQVAVFEGPFAYSPLDVNPTQLADSTSPYTGPATGTLTQADELVVGTMAQADGATTGSYGANNSFTLHGVSSAGTGANSVSGGICYRVVTSTASVTPEFTSGVSSTGTVGTASFKMGTVGSLAATESPDVAAIDLSVFHDVALDATESGDIADVSLDVDLGLALAATESPDVAYIVMTNRRSSSFYAQGDLPADNATSSSSFYREDPGTGGLSSSFYEQGDLPEANTENSSSFYET